MKKQEVNKDMKELKTKLQEGKVILGKDRVLKGLKNGGLNKVYLASNCPSDLKGDIEHYTKLSGIPVLTLNLSNEEVGIFCKKNFFISVLAVKEE
jgi:large subunit ribosomal protein L30e